MSTFKINTVSFNVREKILRDFLHIGSDLLITYEKISDVAATVLTLSNDLQILVNLYKITKKLFKNGST